MQIVDLSHKRPTLPAEIPTTSDPNARGVLTPHTYITFYKDAKSPIRIKGSNNRPVANSILQPNFKFEDMGIGGLDNEFADLS